MGRSTKRAPLLRSDEEMALVEIVGCVLVCVGLAVTALLSGLVGVVATGLAASLTAAIGVGVIIVNAKQ